MKVTLFEYAELLHEARLHRAAISAFLAAA
jgi:hypothetical protein